MTKLKVPVSALQGTPLTVDEMKKIVGGAGFYQICKCTYTFKDLTTSVANIESDDPTLCSNKCRDNCNGMSSCSAVAWKFDCGSGLPA